MEHTFLYFLAKYFLALCMLGILSYVAMAAFGVVLQILTLAFFFLLALTNIIGAVVLYIPRQLKPLLTRLWNGQPKEQPNAQHP